MPQGPLAVLSYGLNPSKVAKAINVDAGGDSITVTLAKAYVACPGNATTTLGGNGTIGDVLERLVISPAVLNAGNVTVTDGNTSIPIYVNAGNLTTAAPMTVAFDPGLPSVNGGWSVVAPVSVTVVAVGRFTP